MKPYSDLYKIFKDIFVHIDFVVAERRPVWLSEDNVIDLHVYCEKDHYDFSMEHFSISAQSLSEADTNFGDLLMRSVEIGIFEVRRLLGSMEAAFNYIKGGCLVWSSSCASLTLIIN